MLKRSLFRHRPFPLARFQKRMRSLLLALTVLGSIVFAASFVRADETAPHWTYGGEANPTHWGQLSSDFALCEVGRDQSPIDVERAIASTPSTLQFDYAPAPLVVVNNGHTIQVNYAPGSTVTIDGESYELVQFHFHTPSEHLVAGQAFAMELHLVHRNAAGQLAVVGVLLESGEAHPAIDTIWAHVPPADETQTVEDMTINAADLLPTDHSYFSYAGSLTTPPCSEGVSWYVLQEPVSVSEEQIAAFTALYPVNARPVQPTNGRRVELHEDGSQSAVRN